MIKHAYFAGGCFWCMVSPFDVLEGILEVTSGYMGGDLDDPDYEAVKTQTTGHYEVIQIKYDDEIIDYDLLLQAFWRQVDPTDPDGQFQDRGPSYRTAIFYSDDEQFDIAQKSKVEMDCSGRYKKPIVTPILKADKFYKAEEYHQDFYKKDPDAYYEDRSKSGRDEFIKATWGDDYYTIYEKN